MKQTLTGYKRPDGSVGIRNKILILSVDECSHGIAMKIKEGNENVVVLTNHTTCMLGGNEEIFHQMVEIAKHPNVAGCLVLSMGCGSIMPDQVSETIRRTGKSVKSLIVSENGGTVATIEKGRTLLSYLLQEAKACKREPIRMEDLILGVKCGGSDTSSGLASNPSVGEAVDSFVDMGATVIGGELFEYIGCESNLVKRAVNKEVAGKLEQLLSDEKKRWHVDGTAYETMSIGNSLGGLTTIEEKSLGALHKIGSKPIQGVLRINRKGIEKPEKKGLYLSETTMLCGGSAANFLSLGAQAIMWTTGSAGFSHPLIPVVLVSGNPNRRTADIDVDVSDVMLGLNGIGEMSKKITDKVLRVVNGEKTQIEDYGETAFTIIQKDQRVERLLGIGCGGPMSE